MTHEEVAHSLLTPLWRGISNDYKAKYARNIWRQFEDNIRSAAYTARASEFLSKITMRLGITLHEAEAIKQVLDLIGSGQDRALLKMLRDDATLLVLMVRADNEERKEQYKAKQAAKAESKQQEAF